MAKRHNRLCFLVVITLLVLTACESNEERSVAVMPPILSAKIVTFRTVRWLSRPSQTIRVEVNKASDINGLVDSALFNGFQPGMTDEEASERFGKPLLTRTDSFGGSWSKYPTSLGYVELGWDRRTSPVNQTDKLNSEGRRSLRAFTDKQPSEIFRPPLRAVLEALEQLSSKAENREVRIFDSNGKLVLNFWLKTGKIEYLELFR